jgi:hypothetical protein
MITARVPEDQGSGIRGQGSWVPLKEEAPFFRAYLFSEWGTYYAAIKYTALRIVKVHMYR